MTFTMINNTTVAIIYGYDSTTVAVNGHAVATICNNRTTVDAIDIATIISNALTVKELTK